MNMSKKYTIGQLNELLINKPLKITDDTYKSIRDGVNGVTNDGYKVIIRWNHIFKDEYPEIFHKRNPYTIDNIRQYIKNNKIDVELLSDTYIGNQDDLLWKCSCGSPFQCSWNEFSQGHHKHTCNQCSMKANGKRSRIPNKEIIKALNNKDLQLLNIDDNLCVTSTRINAIDSNGYKYDFLWSDFSQEKYPQKFHSSNKYAIENINQFLKTERNGEYFCISAEYKRNTQSLKFRHICGHVFDASLVEMQGKYAGREKYYKQCPKCKNTKTESNHALVLKQIFLHKYPSSIIEDPSCRNPQTNRPLPTDIVNHELKIAIEIQSHYHDSYEQQQKDLIKKEYWLHRGYNFYDPDIRNYTILEMCQLFFPDLTDIPDYINYNFANCINCIEVQNYLDFGYSIKEIGMILEKPEGSIRQLVTTKKVFLPSDYKEKILNWKPIVRLGKDGSFIKRYDTLSAIKIDGFATGTVIRVLKQKQDFAYNSYWVYENDYMNNTYTIPREKEDHYMMAVDKYDMYDNFIASYSTIYDAADNSMSSRSEIYRVACGNRKSSRNEKWKFKTIV